MKSNECVEVLPDGTVYYFDLDVCQDEAEKTLDELQAKQNKIPNFDFTASVFSLFIYSIHILSNSGWTPEDLISEVLTHTDPELLEGDDEDDEEKDDGEDA